MSPRGERSDDEIEELLAEAIEARARRANPPYNRRKVDTAMWGLGPAVLVQFITVVWFAASLNGAVTELHDTTRELTAAVNELRQAQGKTHEKVEILDAILDERTQRNPRAAPHTAAGTSGSTCWEATCWTSSASGNGYGT